MSATKPAMPASSGAPYTVPPEPNRVPAILLALAVHAALLAFLWVGISWQNTEPPAVEAEVWDMKVQSAAPPPPPPPPQEVVEPEPRPEPTPVPPAPVPKAAEPEPVKPAPPDINLEREKKLAEQKKQRELAEKRELEQKKERERELAELKKKEEARKLAEQKELEKKKALEKQAEEKKLAEAKAQADKKKLAAEKAAKAKAEAADQAKLDKLRELELKRITGAAGASAGDAQKSTAPKVDAGYVSRLTALIKSNTNFTGSTDVPGNPKAVFKVEQLPTGEILSVRLTKSSGVPQFDEAVERGINKSSPLPKKKDGTVERNLVVNFSMKDLD